LRLTPDRRSRVDGTRVLTDRNALRGFGAYKAGVHKDACQGQNRLRARIMGGGAAPAGVPCFVRNWRATQNKTMNSYTIDITL
jgi:hypothetical protein